MDSLISKFISENVTVVSGKRLMNKDVADAWVAATGGTAGRNKLYAAIYALPGVYKGQGFFTNVHLTPKEVPVVAPVEVVDVAAHFVQAPGLTVFEQMQLDLQRQALEDKERARLAKMEAEAKLAREELARKAAKDAEDAKLAREKIDADKLKAEAEAKLAREKIEADKLKAEAEAKLAREKIEADKLKAEAEAKLAREKMEADAKAVREKIAAKLKISDDSNATMLAMTKMKVDATMEAIRMKAAEGERNREFHRIENNKARAFHAVSTYNRWLDPEVFGTASKQYVTGDSLLRCMEFNAWDWAGEHNKMAMQSLKNTISSMEEKIEVVLDGKLVDKPLVDIQAATKLIESVDTGIIPAKVVDEGLKLLEEIPVTTTTVETTTDVDTAKMDTTKVEANDVGGLSVPDFAGSQTMLLQRMMEVPKIASRDEDRHMQKERDWMANPSNSLTAEKAKKLKKRKYIRKMQSASIGPGGNILLKCDCCGVMMDMDDGNCHRGHNLPDSCGGSWSEHNIRLICANCNQKMGKLYTIREFKVVEMYVAVVYEEVDASSEEEVDASSEDEVDASSEDEVDASSDH
jgi:5-methylcytosine-specific restriction endonuclease McrA